MSKQKKRIRVHYNPLARITTVVCGKQASEVEWTPVANAVTCVSCMKHPDIRKREVSANGASENSDS